MYFLFNPDRIVFEVSRLKRISGKLSEAADDVKVVETALDSDTYETVLDRLKIYENNLSQTGIRMDNLSQGLSLVRDDYFNTENRNCGRDGAPDWLKWLTEGKDALLEWLDGFLHGDGSSDSSIPWIVAMGGQSISVVNSLLGGVLFGFDNANGRNGLYALGGLAAASTGDILGLGAISGAADWHLLHFTESENAGYAFAMDSDNQYGAFTEGLGFSVLDGSASADFFGMGSVGASAGLLNAGVTANGGFSGFVDGEWDPGFYGDLSANASVLNGSVNGQLGPDGLNLGVGANGSVLSANAGGQFAAGRIVQADGDVVHGYIAGVDVGASVVQGEATGCIDIFGIKIEGGINGALGDVGFTAGGELTTGSVGINLGAGLVAGFGIRARIDWTDFELPDIDWPDWELPEIDWPEIEWPEIDFPDWELPEIELPDWMSW